MLSIESEPGRPGSSCVGTDIFGGMTDFMMQGVSEYKVVSSIYSFLPSEAFSHLYLNKSQNIIDLICTYSGILFR
jgi:hypothetical protein